MLEHLATAAREKRADARGNPDDHRLLFTPKAYAVVVVGGCGAHSAAKTVASALNKFGFILAPGGALAWNDGGGEDDVYKDAEFAANLARLGDDLLTLAKAIK